jgi:ABC-type nickel/cobalt efflux system permease component RcnA
MQLLKPWQRRVAGFIVLLFLFGLPAVVLAHPLGDFTISRYSRLELNPDTINITYVVDMAEIPTFQERPYIDTNGDDTLSAAEKEAYLSELAQELHRNLQLIVDDTSTPLAVSEQSLEIVPGNGGLDTLRIELHLTANLESQDAAWQVEYKDNNYAGRAGWQEVIVQAGPEVVLLESSAPTEDLSRELRDYPEDIEALETNRATVRFEPIVLSEGEKSSISVAVPSSQTNQSLMASEDTEFAELINASVSTPTGIFLVLVAAFGWGAAHAFTPGHGKTVVAAYLVGTRGTVKHALFLGLTTTITHTAGVFALGFLTLFASQYILPEQLYPWLAVGSGLLVVSIGFSMFRGRLSGLRNRNLGHHHHDHTHDHDHAHDHSHDHGHSGEHSHGFQLFHHHHGDGHDHSHLPPGSNDTPITWQSLLALGVSGGLIPCPAALIVMLSAISLQRVDFGMVLIIAFSIGLASVLTAIGILWVKARDLLNHFSRRNNSASSLATGRIIRVLPVFSALLITVIGLGLTFQALLQAGAFGS